MAGDLFLLVEGSKLGVLCFVRRIKSMVGLTYVKVINARIFFIAFGSRHDKQRLPGVSEIRNIN